MQKKPDSMPNRVILIFGGVQMEWLSVVAKEHGLFVALVVYVMYSNQQREKRYISVIEQLSDSFQSMKNDLKEIKNKIWGGSQ
jgi:hypothetical protein